MLEVLFGIVAMICIGAFILGAIAFVFGKIATFYDDNKDEIKTMAKKSLDYTNQNTSKVRDYAIIIVCIAVIIALIAFFVK